MSDGIAANPVPAWRLRGRVHIVARDIWRRDGIGNFCFQIAALLRSADIATTLYAENADPVEDIRPLADVFAAVAAPDILLYHFSIEDPAFAALARLDCAKILYFHGITPARFFTGIDPRTEELVTRGLEQCSLARRFDVLMANSRVTAASLINGMGPGAPTLDHVLCCPPVLGPARWETLDAEPVTLPASPRLLLYVGRVSPHKGVDDLIAIFSHLARLADDIHLAIVGSGSPVQLQRLTAQAAALGVGGRVTFFQNISEGALKTLHLRCDALISCSHHEGFCIPVADALLFDKPVFCRPDPAMLEVAGAAAVVLPDECDAAAKARVIADTLAEPARLAALAAHRKERRAALLPGLQGAVLWQALAQAAPVIP